jgi:hypothetical protein
MGSGTTERPDPRLSFGIIPEDKQAVAIEDDQWTIREGGRCSRKRVSDEEECGRPAVAAVMRGVGITRWADLCDRHLYGRWVEDGKVWHWVLRPKTA